MKPHRFHHHGDYVEIDIASWEMADLPSRGDVYLTIQVASQGFTGHNDLWVHGAAFAAFCESLVRLEAERKGEARLSAIDPRELSLTVRSVDSAGHMVIEGHTGYWINRDVTSSFHGVQFGIEFDPSQLIGCGKAGWLTSSFRGEDSSLA